MIPKPELSYDENIMVNYSSAFLTPINIVLCMFGQELIIRAGGILGESVVWCLFLPFAF